MVTVLIEQVSGTREHRFEGEQFQIVLRELYLDDRYLGEIRDDGWVHLDGDDHHLFDCVTVQEAS